MKKFFGVLSILSIFFFLAGTSVHAATEPLLLKPTGSCPDTKDGAARQCVDGLCSGTNIPCNYSLQDIQNNAVGIGNWIFGIIGTIVLAMFIYGGFLWLISGGNSENVNKGKSIMIGSVIGILLVFGAGTIVKVFLKAIGADPEVVGSLPLQGNTATPTYGPPAPPPATYACSCSTPDGVYKTCGKPSGKKDTLGLNEFLCLADFKNYLKEKTNNFTYSQIDILKGTSKADFDAKMAKYQNQSKCTVVLSKNCK